MFRDLNGYYSRPPRPEPRKPKLTPRQEKMLLWIVSFNLLMAFVGPFCGSTAFLALVAMLAGR